VNDSDSEQNPERLRSGDKNQRSRLDRDGVTSGKTFADVLDTLLIDKRKFSYFTLLAILVPGVVMLVALVVFGQFPKWLGAERTQISIGGFETQFLFKSTSANKTEYLVIVHPQGWQDTGIEVEKGARMSFRAGGQIHIDFNGLKQQAEDRNIMEKRLEKSRNLDRNSDDQKRLPEMFFSDEWDPKTHETFWAHLKDQRRFRPWVGPEGYQPTLQAWRARQQRRAFPDARLGELIGQIKDAKGNPVDKPFEIGTGIGMPDEHTKEAGHLWLAINDVVDPTYPELFFADNLGFCWVKVVVEMPRFSLLHD